MANGSVDGMWWDFLLNFFLFEETSYMGSKLPMEGYKMDLDISRVTRKGSWFTFTSEFRAGNRGT